MSRAFAFLVLISLGALAPVFLLDSAQLFARLSPLFNHTASWFSAAFLGAAGAGAWLAKYRCRRADRPLAAFAKLSLSVAAVLVLMLLAVERFAPELGRLLSASESIWIAATAWLAASLFVGLPGFLCGLGAPLAIHGCVRSLSHLAVTTTLAYGAALLGLALGCYAANSGLLTGELRELFVLLILIGGLGLVTLAVASRDPVTLFGSSTAVDLAARGFSRFILPPRMIRRLALLTGLVAAGALMTSIAMFPGKELGVIFAASLGMLAAALTANLLVRIGAGFLPALLMLFLAGSLWTGLSSYAEFLQTIGYPRIVVITFWILGLAFPFLIRLVEPFSREAGAAVADLLLFHGIGAAAGILIYRNVVLENLESDVALASIGVITAVSGLLIIRFMTTTRSGYAVISVAALIFSGWRFVVSSSG